MQFDPLSDAFTRIFNAEQAGHYEVTVNPASKMLDSMLSIMQTSNYIGEYEKIDNGRGGSFRVCTAECAGCAFQQFSSNGLRYGGK